jgi:cobyrinic acid a,c-diamide synthase
MSGALPKRGLMIAAPRSGSGKTTLTLGLLRALSGRGLAVAGAKSGPDYIDGAFLAAAAKRESVNLDSWAMSPALARGLGAALDGDLLVVEASMGLFDGAPPAGNASGASADIAAWLGLPIVLILDVSGQAQSAAAIAKGFASYDERVRIAGIVLNKVGSERHRRLAGDAVAALGLPVLGALPRQADIALPERHLGLVQAAETADLDSRLDALGRFVAAHVDLDALLELAAPVTPAEPAVALRPPGQRIAVARDAAFTFLYPHLLSGWRAAGAEIVFFSPLADEAPPLDADACWLPGGYPELHSGRLAAAHKFLAGLRRFAETRAVHGECGGYMVLGRTLTDAEGTRHEMAGLLSVETSFFKRRMTLGYRRARLLADGPLGARDEVRLGHEFHYATLAAPGDDAALALVADAYGAEAPAGSRRGLVSGSFFHVIAESAA